MGEAAYLSKNKEDLHNSFYKAIPVAMVPKVPDSERFSSRIEPPNRLCSVAPRYGYKDSSDSYGFETQLVEKMTEFLKWQCNSNEIEVSDQSLLGVRGAVLVGNKGNGNNEELGGGARRRKVRFQLSDGQSEELSSFMEAQEAGMAYIIGNTRVMAGDTSSLFKRFVINIIYGSLRSISRRPATTLAIPQSSLVEVCMVYRV
ncbi:hypothetical protein K2173_000732 [Erythroxylum novogranatense]|uniref:K+ potassium transporter C-terminal domain-containing protein n=1 Tax=Erythroxylum novogranatense TaxID=1862640 RepID=A0AAV8SI96_9ROSI|nr:hypothetical protein K2173_000732 [Erythroxylum novogranatense]